MVVVSHTNTCAGTLVPMNAVDRAVLGSVLTAERVPTRRELASMTGKSTSTVQRSVDRLEREGFIERAPFIPRSLEVIALP